MIISIEIENWMAFKDATLFTMIASKERQHNERVVRISKYPLRILPVTSIYGGNASGKTIFFKALRFAKDFIVNGLKTEEKIPVDPFRLDPDYKSRPTNFRFELLIDELIYEYSFALKDDAVIEEKLVKITSSSETELFYRKNGDLIELNKSLPERERLRFAFDGTDSNQLFLTNSISQKLTAFKPVSDWFKKKLVLIGPQTHSGPLTSYVSNKGQSYKNINKSLQDLDTGILYLDGETITLESLQLSESLKEQVKRSVTDNIAIELTSPDRAERIMIYKKDDGLVAKKLVSYHRQANGGKIKFEIADESDGTRRLIELLPGFNDMSSKNNDKVYVIDELDRSLHTLLTRQLINSYLCSCNGETRSQLIFTTHDLLLMDQELLRRDEMWVTEKDYEGAATLISFAEYKDIRSDKDIRKSYLQGRFGGVPKILIDDCLIMNDSEG